MARFSGDIGFATTKEAAPGVWEDVIVEEHFFGNVLQNTMQSDVGDTVLPEFSYTNSISIVAGRNVLNRRKQMRYIRFEGELWYIDRIEIEGRRLNLSLGGVYNGPTGTTPSAA